MNPALVPSIVCPKCQADVGVDDASCPHCGSSLYPPAPGESHPGGTAGAEAISALDRPWVLAVLLLHVGFLGIPWYWKTRYSARVRWIVCLVSVLYTAVAVGLIVFIGSWLWHVLAGSS